MTWVDMRYMDTYFHFLDIAQTWMDVENETIVQLEVELTPWSSAGPLRVSIKPQGSCQSKGQHLTASRSRLLLSSGPLKVVTARPFISPILFSIPQRNLMLSF